MNPEIIGNAELWHGNALNIMKLLPDNSIDMIWTDPPYGHNNNNGDLISCWEAALGKGDYVPERDNRPIENDGIEAGELYKKALHEFKRLLKPGSVCCCGGGGPDPQFARWTLWMDEILGFKMAIVWDKGPMGMGWHYRRSYEFVLVSQQQGGVACKWYDTTNKIENVIRRIGKIIPSASQHPTEKPVALAKHFIKLHTQSGDTVLDPFIGAGSGGVAAVEMGCKFIGIEIDRHWFDISRQKILSAQQQSTLI